MGSLSRGIALASVLALAGCTGTISADPGGGGGDDGSSGSDGGGGGGTPDGAPTTGGSLRIVVMSDMNASYGSTTYGSAVHGALARVLELQPDVVLSAGDQVAGQMSGLDYSAMWAGFHSTVSDPLTAAGIPYAPTPGNHDASGYPGYEGERTVYANEWNARRPAVEFLDGSQFPWRYSFVIGPALFISLDDTLTQPLSADQRSWVESQLVAGADRPVKIVYGHVPIHPFTVGREVEVTHDAELEAILVAHGVSLFISGHHHGYYPGRHGQLRVVSTSCLGDAPRPLIGTGQASPRTFLVVEVASGAIASVEAYPETDFGVPIDRATLPASLSYGGVTVTRDDL